MNAQLARAMIQRQRRGVTPPASITAPIVERLDHTTEADRLATFDQSARTVGGKVAPFVPAAAAVPNPKSPAAAVGQSDPFDHYHAQPLHPMTDAEGRQYEIEEMHAGRELRVNARGFFIHAYD